MPKVSVIIPTMKGREAMLKRLLESLPIGVETIVVDDENLLLAAKRNKGARLATEDYFLFIDDDNYFINKINEINVIINYRDIGAIGLVACYGDRPSKIADGGSFRFYTSGLMWGVNTNKDIKDVIPKMYEVDEIANAFIIPRVVFDAVGGFDEENFPIDMDEADICKRIKDIGLRVMMNPCAICYHDSQTYSNIPDFRRPMNCYFMARNKVLFQKKHLNKFQLAIYFLIFFPMFLVGYTACLLYRGKPNMVLHYWKGSLDGIFCCKKNPYQQS